VRESKGAEEGEDAEGDEGVFEETAEGEGNHGDGGRRGQFNMLFLSLSSANAFAREPHDASADPDSKI
jgi:hypothetical protein